MFVSNYLWVLFVAVGVSATPLTNITTRLRNMSRMLGGRESYFGQYPFMVSLMNTVHFCGGSIINSYYVLTAAHCVAERHPSQYFVAVGVTDICQLESPYQNPLIKGVEVHVLHPSYILHRADHDIAIIKVRDQFQFNVAVQPLPLATEFIITPYQCTTLGWGATLADPAIKGNYMPPDRNLPHLYKAPCILREGKVMIHENACVLTSCSSPYTIIAGYGEETPFRYGSDARVCVGDSGSPLICAGKVHGVVSSSADKSCLRQGAQPGIYTRVPGYIDWIRYVMNVI